MVSIARWIWRRQSWDFQHIASSRHSVLTVFMVPPCISCGMVGAPTGLREACLHVTCQSLPGTWFSFCMSEATLGPCGFAPGIQLSKIALMG